MIWIFWEVTSGIISICSALGSTVDTCMASVYEVMASFTFFLRVRELGSRGTSWLSLSTETGLHSANCAADREDLTDTVLGWVVDAPVVVQRQVPWFRKYRIPRRFRSCSSVNRWPMSLLCWFAVAVHRQGLFCLMGVFARLRAFFALRPLGRRVPGGGDAGSLLPGVLPPN